MDFFSYILLCKGEMNMILTILVCLALCPTILLIWLCTCIIKTSQNTQVIANVLTRPAAPAPQPIKTEIIVRTPTDEEKAELFERLSKNL